MRTNEDVLFKKRRLLHDTVRNGNCFKLRYLLEKRGENIDTRDSKRQTALMVAVYTKYASKKISRSVLDLVLKANPDLNVVDSSARTALIHACMSNNLQAVRLLVSENALDLWMDAQDCEGMTSLMYAVRNKNSKMVAVLLSPWKQLGLSKILENKYGENVMDIALVESEPRICELLRENGFYAQNNMSHAFSNNLNEGDSTEEKIAQTPPRTMTVGRSHGMTAVRRVKSCLASLNNNHLTKKKNRISQDDSCSTLSSRTSTLSLTSLTSNRHSNRNSTTKFSSSSSIKSCENPTTFSSPFSTKSNRNSSISSSGSTTSSRSSTLSSTSSTNQQQEQLHHIFNLYAQQLSPSYKTSASSPVCLDDREDAESLDSLASIQSFRSVGGFNDNITGLSTRSSPMVSGKRSRRSGAGLVVPAIGRLRKTSAPCFPSNRMFKSSLLSKRGEMRPNLIH